MSDADDLLARAARPTLEAIRRLEEEASPPLRPVMAAIRANLFEPGFNVERLTRATGASKWLLTGFTAEIGITPWQYICESRLETGGRLLRDSDLAVDEVAYLLGYSSLSVFQRAFHRWCELSPSKYRDLSRLVRNLPERYLHWRWWYRYGNRNRSAADQQTLAAHLESIYGPTGR